MNSPCCAFSREEVQALLAAPNAATWCGRRDVAMFALLYNTCARLFEIIGLRVADVKLAATSSVRLHGKRRKQRTVPLWKETAAAIRQWLKYADLRVGQLLILHRNRTPMTRTNLADLAGIGGNGGNKDLPTVGGTQDFAPYLPPHYGNGP